MWGPSFLIIRTFTPEKASFTASLAGVMFTAAILISQTDSPKEFFNYVNRIRLVLVIVFLMLPNIRAFNYPFESLWSVFPALGLAFIVESLASRFKPDKKVK